LAARAKLSVHQAAKLQFERVGREFAEWRLVPDDERSPAPAWWWGPAMEVLREPETMSADLCASLDLSSNATYASGAKVLMKSLADQTKRPYPDEFPRKFGI
jgi:hypothetical protein